MANHANVASYGTILFSLTDDTGENINVKRTFGVYTQAYTHARRMFKQRQVSMRIYVNVFFYERPLYAESIANFLISNG